MATKVWAGNAHALKQITTLTVAGTWAANDTEQLTIGGKDLIITIGNGTTTAQVAASIRDAWNATSRIDGTGDNTNTSNMGGQEHGEFSEMTAVIYSTATSVVRLIGNKAGVPITVTSAATTAGDGDVTLATAQAATGPNHWNNADNWHTTAGVITTVPATDDVLVFKNSNVSVKYGLPASALNVTLQVWQSFTGHIGLYDINTDNGSKPYKEYRARHVELDDDGAGTSVTHTFGLGEGAGSNLINVVHTYAGSGLTVNANVFNTGTPQVPGTKALNLIISNEADDGTITLLKGSVNLADQFGKSPEFGTLNVAYTNSQASDVDCLTVVQVAHTINQSGGRVELAQVVTSAGNFTLSLTGGTFITNGTFIAATVSLTILNGTVIWNSSETIDTLIIGSKGVLDLEKDKRALTISTCDLFEGASLLDEFARGTYTAGVDLNRCGIDDVTLRLGNNRRLTPGTAA